MAEDPIESARQSRCFEPFERLVFDANTVAFNFASISGAHSWAYTSFSATWSTPGAVDPAVPVTSAFH